MAVATSRALMGSEARAMRAILGAWALPLLPRAGRLIRTPEAHRRNAELVAVLGDGAPSDFDPAFGKLGGGGVVAERAGLVFRVDDLFERRFDGVPGDLFAGLGLGAAGEEAAQRHNAPGSQDVFFRDGAADGRDMDAE